jgi:hypothetical protein
MKFFSFFTCSRCRWVHSFYMHFGATEYCAITERVLHITVRAGRSIVWDDFPTRMAVDKAIWPQELAANCDNYEATKEKEKKLVDSEELLVLLYFDVIMAT